jgi:hypothetical protein
VANALASSHNYLESIRRASSAMSIAPPTPPPTGATELMDQEKEATVAVQAAIPAAPVTETAPPASGSTANTANADRYRVELQALADLIPHNISEVIRVAELADLNVCSTSYYARIFRR